MKEKDSDSQLNNLESFGFSTPLLRRSLVLGFIAFLMGLFYYTFDVGNKKESSCEESNKELLNDYLKFTKEQIYQRDSFIKNQIIFEKRQKQLEFELKTALKTKQNLSDDN